MVMKSPAPSPFASPRICKDHSSYSCLHRMVICVNSSRSWRVKVLAGVIILVPILTLFLEEWHRAASTLMGLPFRRHAAIGNLQTYVGPVEATVCTYFEPFSSIRSSEFESVLAQWRKSWSRQGWKTRILTERDAAKHPAFKALKEKFRNLPTVNDANFEMACYIRWVAMVASGCRWMTDIDVINFGFPPQQPWHGPVVYSFGGVMPALVTGSTAAFQAVVDALEEVALNPLNSSAVVQVNGKPHVSDMLIFANKPHLYLPLSFPLYSSVSKSLANSPLVHFSFDDAVALRKRSKVEVIDDARRFAADREGTDSVPTVCTYTPGRDAGPAASAEWEETFPAWKESWTAQGWATQVLTEKDAARHPRFPDLLEKFTKLAAATADETSSDTAGVWRYVRWVAAVTVGCRWLCDSDLVNLGFPPQAPWHGPVLYSFDGPQPTLVTGSPSAFQSVLDAFEEAATAAAEGHLSLPSTSTDDGRPVIADARVLGSQPGLFLDTYFPMNLTGAAARASSVLLHLDAADAKAAGLSRSYLLRRTRGFVPDSDSELQ